MKIAISGKANSGKNTLAGLIQSKSGLETKTYAFADPIKQIALKIFPFLDKNILWGPSYLRETKIPIVEGWGLDKDDLTYRDILLKIGEQHKKMFGKDIWINSVFYQIKNCASYDKKNNLTLISDVRFKNELQACKDNDFLLIRIKRDGIKRVNKENHISEVDLNDVYDDQFDIIIDNSAGINELSEQVNTIISTHFPQ